MESMETKNSNNRGAYIQQIMSDMKNGVLALDKKGNVIYSNPQMNSFLEKEKLVGQTVHSLMCENENSANDGFWDIILDVIHGHVIHYQKRASYTAPSGRGYKFHIVSSYLNGEAGGIVITVADETEYESLIQKSMTLTSC